MSFMEEEGILVFCLFRHLFKKTTVLCFSLLVVVKLRQPFCTFIPVLATLHLFPFFLSTKK